MTSLKAGDLAPKFNTVDQNDAPQKLTDYKGKWVILYFYPKAMTPGCTTQACSLRDAKSELLKLNAVPLGVSPDKPSSLKKFEAKEGLNFTLLSDTDHTISEAYGAWQEKSLYGKRYMGTQRMTFVIDPAGKIAFIIPKVDPKTHLDEVINLLKKINK